MAGFDPDDREMRRILFALGWTLKMIVANPVEAWFVYMAFRYRPWAAFQMSRLIIGESIKTTARLGYGTARIVAPETTEKIRGSVEGVRRFFNRPIPDWMKTGSDLSKQSFVGNVVATGIGMVNLQYDRAESGDFGGDVTMSDFITQADSNVEMNTVAHEPYQSRPFRFHRLGGPGGIII
jgi:hypothetical protein